MSSKNVLPAKADAPIDFSEKERKESSGGLEFPRFFTREGVSPYDEIEWETRNATITNEKGEVIFEQKGVEIPKSWSQTATNIVVSKYFHGQIGTPERESSARQLIERVARTMTEWGVKGGYFATDADAASFHDELAFLLLNQYVAFNSPVWFNCGIEPKPQCSACFINSVDDTMDSILDLAKTEGRLFKWGSGTGTNLSPIRSSRARLSGGGTASGPVSFMKGYDAFAGVIKSGGKTRRAAKMVILDIDHPDIVDFIECKAREEKKAWTLMDAGYDGAVDGEAYGSIFFQNANNSVRVTDEFMKAVEDDLWWETRERGTNDVMGRYKARDLMRRIAESAHICGDPGMQFDTTINRWHTSKNTAKINASNPCVTGDTLVATADGWQRIDALAGKSARIVGADGMPHFVERIFPTGRKQVFRLRTRAGYEVRITADHKVLTADRGDVPVRDLQVGDRVQLQGPGFGRRALGERLALAIGVAVGDGCLSRSTASGRMQEFVILTMSAEERGVLDTIAVCLNEEKGLRRAVGMAGNPSPVHVTARGTGARLAFSSQSIVDLFKEFAVLDEGSHLKRFTPAVYELDKASTASLLRGLFTADGTVSSKSSGSQYVSLDSTSLELLHQVQLLLLGFGMKSKIYRNRFGNRTEWMLPDGRGGERSYPVRELHSLRISCSSRFMFEREIGFDPSSRKAAALRAMNDEFGAYHDVLSDKVTEIEALGEEDVFDLTEPVTSHFVANGLVVHNCSEYVFLDDTACNLASFNLMKFVGKDDDIFDVTAFRKAVDVVISAQEFIVDNASYPTERIAANSRDFRPLGMGYANLGALLMFNGRAYDSDAGRDFAAAITAVMTGEAYLQSARIAAKLGPFPGYARNKEPFLEVIRMHRAAVQAINPANVPKDLMQAAQEAWDLALLEGSVHGFKNAQATVLAPTGTIGFMMDCDTTGVEPDLALVKFKKLVGGGMMKIVNHTVPHALRKLGYPDTEVRAIAKFIDENGTIEGAPFVRAEHLPVFDCAFKPQRGSRSIHYMGHVKMMSAVQPFISGAISKTVNVPENISIEEIAETYMESWKMGIKAIAIYRDNSKRTQPLSAATMDRKAEPAPPSAAAAFRPVRRKLPAERRSITHKFSIGGHEGYITVGMYDDGQPGEIFLVMAKEGSAISGLMDSFATAISLALQYGVPLRVLIDKFSHVRFEPSGHTGNAAVPYAKSIVDYIFRWLAAKFLTDEEKARAGVHVVDAESAPALAPVAVVPRLADPSDEMRSMYVLDDAPTCAGCGSIMVRNGSCYKCINCGETSGCS